MDLLFLKHLHPLTMVTPDHSHIMELLDNTQNRTQELSFLINQAHTISVQMKQVTKWTTRVYQNGVEPISFTTEQSSHIDQLLGHIESRNNGNSMRYYATYHWCIHCKGAHTSEDHHLSVSVPPVFNSGHIGLLLPLEQTQTRTNNNTPRNYKNMQFLLPSQQSAFTAAQRQPWPLPPKPTPPTQFQHSTGVTTSSASTRKSWISSTTNRMSSTLPLHPYCC